MTTRFLSGVSVFLALAFLASSPTWGQNYGYVNIINALENDNRLFALFNGTLMNEDGYRSGSFTGALGIPEGKSDFVFRCDGHADGELKISIPVGEYSNIVVFTKTHENEEGQLVKTASPLLIKRGSHGLRAMYSGTRATLDIQHNGSPISLSNQTIVSLNQNFTQPLLISFQGKEIVRYTFEEPNGPYFLLITDTSDQGIKATTIFGM